MQRMVLALGAFLIVASTARADALPPPPPPPPPPVGIDGFAPMIAGGVAGAGCVLAGVWLARRSQRRVLAQG